MMNLIVTPKAVGIVTGISSVLAIQVAQAMQGTPATTEWTILVGIGTGALGWGVAWGTMRTKLAAQEVARRELKADADKVASRLETDNTKVAAKVEEVAKKVDDHTDKLRVEMRENAKEHQGRMDTILREIGVLSAAFDATIRDTRQMIADHTASCPMVAKPRKRSR